SVVSWIAYSTSRLSRSGKWLYMAVRPTPAAVAMRENVTDSNSWVSSRSASAVKIFSRVRSRCSSRDPPMILGMPYCHTSARIDITLGWCHGSARRGTRAGTTAHLSPEYRTPAPWGRRPRERVTGIEPALSAWEAEVLPLNYTRDVPLDRCGGP